MKYKMLNKYEKKKCGLGDPSNGLHDPATPPRPSLEVINGNAVVYMYVKWKEKLVALRVCFSLEIVISCWCSILYLGFMIYNDRN